MLHRKQEEERDGKRKRRKESRDRKQKEEVWETGLKEIMGEKK